MRLTALQVKVRAMRLLLVALLFLVVGCSRPPADTQSAAPSAANPSRAPSQATGPGSTTASSKRPTPPTEEPDATPPGSGVVEKICAHRCAGPRASLILYRDASGALARIRFDGDLDVCSHPPSIYYDANGKELLAVANQPVKSKDEAEANTRRQQEIIAKLTVGEKLRCSAQK